MDGRNKLALLVAGIAIGAILVGPAGAHITDSVVHLWGDHLKDKVTDLTYTKNAANGRFSRSSFRTFKKQVAQGSRQQISGTPFSVTCDNNPADAQIEYEAPEKVTMTLDDGEGFVLTLHLDEGQTSKAPKTGGFQSQVSTWIILGEGNTYTRYIVRVTSNVGPCDGSVETILVPKG